MMTHRNDYPAGRALGFAAIRLNRSAETGWAVIDSGSGAIALDSDGRLRMRLSQMEAVQVALALSSATEPARQGRPGGDRQASGGG